MMKYILIAMLLSSCAMAPDKLAVKSLMFQPTPEPDLSKPVDWGLAEKRY